MKLKILFFSINYYLLQSFRRNFLDLLNAHKDPSLNNIPLLHNNNLSRYKIQTPSKYLDDPIFGV